MKTERSLKSPQTLSAQRPSNGGHNHQPPSNSELFSSAKLVAEEAQSTFGHESDKVDKAKVADAVENLLEASRHYGKLEDKGLGSYVDKAEGYLNKYSSQSTAAPGSSEAELSEHSRPEAHGEGGDSEGGGGGFGDYMKMAQGFVKSDESSKQESQAEGGGHSTGGFGDYMSMAEGFLKKH